MSTSAAPVPQKKSAQSSEAGAAPDCDNPQLQEVQMVPPLASTSTDSGTSTSEVAITGSKQRREEDWLVDAFDQSGVPDELFTIWESEEAKVLAPQLPCGAVPAGGAVSPPAVPAGARRVCLECFKILTWQFHLPPEAWFGAATLLDSYVHRVGGSVPVADLPLLCTVLIRMQCKEARKGRNEEWSQISLMVAQSLAAAGHAQAMQWAQPANKNDLTLVEHWLLKALQWRVSVPNLEKWTSAYFKRLMVARTLDNHRAVMAWHSAMDQAYKITMLQAPSLEYPPQRLARGLLLLSAERCDLVPLVSTSAFLQVFEAVTDCSTETLKGDCHLARCMMLRTGSLRTAQI